MSHKKYILSGGGTGGHIYPAIAIADEIKQRDIKAEILFVGAKDRMEMEKVPKSGYKIEGLWISGIERKLSLKNLTFPLKGIDSLLKSWKIVKRFKPDIVIGTGGFASGPLLKVANTKGIPTVLQEQNSYAGITNKLLAGKAAKICVAYENMEKYFPKEKIIITGNPVRSDLIDITSKSKEALAFFDLSPEKKTLLILGGSLGAKMINETIARELEFLLDEDMQVIWQCGELYFDKYKTYNEHGNVQVHKFLDRMDLAYAAADIVISRAGAISVSELCLVGKPVLFIPSPNVAEDHQTKNAKALEEKNAALVIKESDLKIEFKKTLKTLNRSETKQKELGNNIKKMAKPNATTDIVDEVIKLGKAI